ncbi:MULTISPECIES: hypothetical protein [unclassified Cryobacterium]|uniref:hypothetical protein n=1 Tax=unclassified Cryobacterium TaxID=2649013 RepID=UPI001069F2A6|nr:MULTISPECIES: hypothetical protein [unclassified Cryobacterium]TFB96277.1 hypothetical protein E3O39_09225 [Cryobacterium sp. MDB2-A-1]TFC12562.1 hypothetical protein E3O35_06390 [Cryobacterium sp. MDB2-A-2]
MNERTLIRARLDLQDSVRRTDQVLAEGARKAAEVHRRVAARISELEQLTQRLRAELDACRVSGGRSGCSEPRRRLAQAEANLNRVRVALTQVDAARTTFAAETRRLEIELHSVGQIGVALLRTLTGDLRDYQAMAHFSLPGASGTGSTGAVPGQAATVPDALEYPPGLPAGFALVPLSRIDISRSTVTGPADFGKGYSPADLSWAFDAFDQVVLPGLRDGVPRDALVDRDTRSGLSGTRSYAMTRSQFLNDGDSIRLNAEPGGQFSIANGQHRIWVALRDGRHSVPARIVP